MLDFMVEDEHTDFHSEEVNITSSQVSPEAPFSAAQVTPSCTRHKARNASA